jgi:hypothetical protein
MLLSTKERQRKDWNVLEEESIILFVYLLKKDKIGFKDIKENSLILFHSFSILPFFICFGFYFMINSTEMSF